MLSQLHDFAFDSRIPFSALVSHESLLLLEFVQHPRKGNFKKPTNSLRGKSIDQRKTAIAVTKSQVTNRSNKVGAGISSDGNGAGN
jgi:hypothetical protein